MPFLTATTMLAAKSFWILDPLYAALGTVLAWFYDVIPSYGVAIILLTLAVRLLTFPLTAKQARSQQQLQKLQPELKRLQAKYKGDKQKLNEEMMKFYKENHVNPFGGCLPLFIQFPVLIVLYRLILGLTRTFIIGFAIVVGAAVAVGGAPSGPLEGVRVQNGHVSNGSLSKGVITKGDLDEAQAVVDGKVVGTVTNAKIVNGKIATAQVMNGKVLVGTMTDLTVTGGQVAGSPKNVPESSSLFRALKASGGKMESWGMNLAKRASETSGSEQVPFVILVLLVGATGFYQQRQLTGRLPKESANSQMAVMGKVFPLIFVFISWSIPAGVVVYFLVSNIWQIGQQAFMFRNQPRPESTAKDSAKPKMGPTPTVGKGKTKPSTTPKTAKGMTTGRLGKGSKNPKNASAKGSKDGTAKGSTAKGSTAKGARGVKGADAPGRAGARRLAKGAASDTNNRSSQRPGQAPRGRTLRSGQISRPGQKKSDTNPKNQALRPGDVTSSVEPKKQNLGQAEPTKATSDHSNDAATVADGGSAGGLSSPPATLGSNGSAPLARPPSPATGDLDKDIEQWNGWK
ncbi:MAG: membrane protein insertase YidC [Acidimicrobiales bacterium]